MTNSELRIRPGDQPLPKSGEIDVAQSVIEHIRNNAEGGHYSPEVYESVCSDIERRIALGVQRYGRRLQTQNGRDSLLDWYEEILDATNYSRQEMLEHPSTKATRRFWFALALVLDTKESLLKRGDEGLST